MSLTDTLLNDTIIHQFPLTIHMESSSQPEITLKKENALRYVGGYVTRMLHQKLQNSKHPMKTELCLCLSKADDIDLDEMHDDSEDWMDTIDQEGVKHITNIIS